MHDDDFDPGGRFRAEVKASGASDPMPTLRALAERLGLPVEDVVHHALQRWAAAGAEALLAGPPEVLVALRRAADEDDLARVRSIVSFLLAGFRDSRPLESVWDYPRPPRWEASDRHVLVVFAGRAVAETRGAVRVLETSHPPVYYLPLADCDRDALVPSRRRTLCEWKGMASYYSLQVADRRAEEAAWGYPSPTTPFAVLRERVAFYPGRVDACYLDGERVAAQPGDFYGGWITAEIAGPVKGGPGTAGW